MDSLWPKFEEHLIEQNNSIQILRTQAKAIKSLTNGVVNATFSKMNYNPGPTNALKRLGETITALSSPTFEEQLEEELQEKTDINVLFTETRYKFEIFNNEYRFRLFVLDYREMFPISLEVDGGILEDISYRNNSPIMGNDELKNIVKEIFSSFKVHSVVSKMLQKNK